ncbi:MAG TPA: NADH-quinone oxidoreductase subunit NuoE [Firmicutes bacterium]|nr:NADH-quinone oxidoreductase subunit NuoE [Bacillota bacterium]
MTTEEVQRKFTKLNEILDKHEHKPSNLVAILQDVQAEYRYLPEEVMSYIATDLQIPASTVFGVATFYAQFSLRPKGKTIIRVCNGTACHVRGSQNVRYAIMQKLGLKEGQDTTDDMQFTVETVSCLGACGLAPVVMIGDEVYGQTTPETMQVIMDQLLAKGRKSDDQDHQ